MSRSIIMSGIAGNNSFIELEIVGNYFVVTITARRDGSIESHSFQDSDMALDFFRQHCTQRII